MSTVTLVKESPRKLLWQCLATSLLVHAATIAFLHTHPMLLQGPLCSLFGMNHAPSSFLEVETAALEEANAALEEVFQNITIPSSHFQKPYDLTKLPKGVALAPSHEKVDLSADLNRELSIATSESRSTEHTPFLPLDEEKVTDLMTEKEEGALAASHFYIDTALVAGDLIVSLPSEEAWDVEESLTLSSFPQEPELEATPPLARGGIASKELKLGVDSTPLARHASSSELDASYPPLLDAPVQPSSTTQSIEVTGGLANEEYTFSNTMVTSGWSDLFDVEVTFLPNPDGQGYIFSLALQPTPSAGEQSLKQNLYFILDRSSSIQKHRFSVFKRAVLKALSSMHYGDTFNILVIDKKLTRFSPENRPVSMKNIQAAEAFLEKQEAGGLFAASDIYLALGKLLPSIPDDGEIHTAILLTDGQTHLNTERKQAALKKWIDKNQGKLALHPCAVGQDNDLLSLDMLASISGGKLLYSDTHASFPRKLAKRVLDLRDPLAKDLIISAQPNDPDAHIELYSASSHLPPLYSHQPYIILGKIDDPCTFDLTIQARHQDQWVAIQKNISLMQGHRGDVALKKHYRAQQASTCYSKFISEGKGSHLKEAKEILQKFRDEAAFK